MCPQADFTWKVVFGGMGGVGKTTFIVRYLTGQFIADTTLTIGVEFHSHVMEHEGKQINLVIWDLGGEDRFRFIQENFIKGAMAALVFFDLSRINTLYELKDWINIIRHATLPSIPILLVGAKSDLVDEEMQQRMIKEAETFVKEMQLVEFICTSSKNGINVQEAMHRIIAILLNSIKFAK